MHEVGIVSELIRLAESAKPAGTRVLELHASVGRLTGVSPAAMEFYFEALRDESLGRQAQLRVRLEPLRGHCAACAATAELDELSWLCPSCGEPRLVIAGGDELNLVAIVLDDGEADHDRTEDPQEER